MRVRLARLLTRLAPSTPAGLRTRAALTDPATPAAAREARPATARPVLFDAWLSDTNLAAVLTRWQKELNR